MPFIIDEEKCTACGTCIGNCPNRAIVRRGEKVFVTSMCCDCGHCTAYCGMRAIGPGPQKAQQDVEKLNAAIRKSLGLKKNIAAVKYADRRPKGATPVAGLSFWCYECGAVFDGKTGPVFFTAQNSTCAGAANLGLGTRETGREAYDVIIETMVVGDGGYYAAKELLTLGRKNFPTFNKTYKGMIIGPLDRTEQPDVILLPVNGKQLCMLSTAYSFETGEMVEGKIGGGTCLATIPVAFLENRPVFSCGDYGGRRHMGLADQELIAAFPFRLVPGLVRNLKRTVFSRE